MSSLINFSGLASGIDSSALIKAVLDQQRTSRLTPLEEKVSTLTETNSSLDKLSDLLETLKTKATSFRAVSGGAISKIASSSDETKTSAVASNGATNGTYSLTVSQLARNGVASFDDRFSSASSAINSSINNGALAADRTVDVSIGTGTNMETVSIELTSSTTAQQFVDSFNSSAENAEASLVNVGTSASPSYAIVITGNYQGTDQGQIAITVGTEIQSAGTGAFTSNTLTQAQNSQFIVSGITGTISRPTNSVTDVISGLTLNFKATGASTVSVSNDADATISTVQDFVDAYNEVVRYAVEQDQITREEDGNVVTNIFSPLANSSLDENILGALRDSLRGASSSSGTARVLADLGITTERDGTLKFDTDTFQDAIDNDSQGVQTILETLGEDLASVNGTISQYTRFNGLIDVQESSNQSQISTLNDRIADIEASLAKQEENLVSRYARLEGLIGQLNSQQTALSSLLPS